MEKVNVFEIADRIKEKWKVVDIANVNESIIRLSVLEGDFHWHVHKEVDEFFFVIEGGLCVETRDKIFNLARGEGIVVSKGVEHKTSSRMRTLTLLVEKPALKPRGD